MLRNTGPVVLLVVARIVGGNNQSLQRQKGLSHEDLLRAVANDELYGMFLYARHIFFMSIAQQ